MRHFLMILVMGGCQAVTWVRPRDLYPGSCRLKMNVDNQKVLLCEAGLVTLAGTRARLLGPLGVDYALFNAPIPTGFITCPNIVGVKQIVLGSCTRRLYQELAACDFDQSRPEISCSIGEESVPKAWRLTEESGHVSPGPGSSKHTNLLHYIRIKTTAGPYSSPASLTPSSRPGVGLSGARPVTPTASSSRVAPSLATSSARVTVSPASTTTLSALSSSRSAGPSSAGSSSAAPSPATALSPSLTAGATESPAPATTTSSTLSSSRPTTPSLPAPSPPIAASPPPTTGASVSPAPARKTPSPLSSSRSTAPSPPGPSPPTAASPPPTTGASVSPAPTPAPSAVSSSRSAVPSSATPSLTAPSPVAALSPSPTPAPSATSRSLVPSSTTPSPTAAATVPTTTLTGPNSRLGVGTSSKPPAPSPAGPYSTSTLPSTRPTPFVAVTLSKGTTLSSDQSRYSSTAQNGVQAVVKFVWTLFRLLDNSQSAPSGLFMGAVGGVLACGLVGSVVSCLVYCCRAHRTLLRTQRRAGRGHAGSGVGVGRRRSASISVPMQNLGPVAGMSGNRPTNQKRSRIPQPTSSRPPAPPPPPPGMVSVPGISTPSSQTNLGGSRRSRSSSTPSNSRAGSCGARRGGRGNYRRIQARVSSGNVLADRLRAHPKR